MQVFVCEFLVRTKSSASISNDKTDHHGKDSTSKNESGQSQFVVKSSLFDGEFTTLHNHDISEGSVVLNVRIAVFSGGNLLGPFLVVSIF